MCVSLSVCVSASGMLVWCIYMWKSYINLSVCSWGNVLISFICLEFETWQLLYRDSERDYIHMSQCNCNHTLTPPSLLTHFSRMQQAFFWLNCPSTFLIFTWSPELTHYSFYLDGVLHIMSYIIRKVGIRMIYYGCLSLISHFFLHVNFTKYSNFTTFVNT